MAYDAQREAAKAAGVALIRQGHSVRTAAQATGVPPSTLQAAVQRMIDGRATLADLARADQALMAGTYALAADAQHEQRERLATGGVETGDLNGMAAMSLRAIGNYRRWNAPQGDTGDAAAGSKLLDRLEAALAAGATLVLAVSPRPPDHNVIDVGVVGDGEDSGEDGE